MGRMMTLTKDAQKRINNKTGLITFQDLKQTELQNLLMVLLTQWTVTQEEIFKATAYFIVKNIILNLTSQSAGKKGIKGRT